MLDAFCVFLSIVGFVTLCSFLYENLRAPYLIFKASLEKLLNPQNALNLKQRFGPWAAITGASDGIGKAYARELARQGLNVVLISRTESKLQAVARDIEQEFGVRTKCIVADFTVGRTIYKHIEDELENIPIGILVNNVGQNTAKIDALMSVEESDVWNMFYTNIVPVTLLSRFFMRRMHKDGIKGIIVNMSSGSELQPMPYAALYSASKAYTRSLTLSLQTEALRYGITVQLLSPYFVVTKINAYSKYIMRGGLFIPQPEDFARWAVSTLGVVDITTGYLWHGVMSTAIYPYNWRIRRYVALRMTKYFRRVNKFDK